MQLRFTIPLPLKVVGLLLGDHAERQANHRSTRMGSCVHKDSESINKDTSPEFLLMACYFIVQYHKGLYSPLDPNFPKPDDVLRNLQFDLVGDVIFEFSKPFIDKVLSDDHLF